jgi:hypothetical protein
MALATGVRILLYAALWVFAVCQLGMTAARLHYTRHIPRGDPLNGGHDFYDPIIAELLATSILSMLWAPLLMVRIHKRHENTCLSTFGAELIGLFVLFMFWITGAGIATHQWGNLAWCRIYQPCRLLTAIVAFSWMGWIMILFLLAINIGYIIINDAFSEPLHGHYDPRLSQTTSMRQSQVV